MFFALVIMLIMTCFTLICKPMENRFDFVKRKIEAWRKSLFWNGYLRFLIEGCLEIFIGVVLNLRINMNASYSDGNFLGPWDVTFHLVNNIAMIILGTFSFLSAVIIIYFYLRNF